MHAHITKNEFLEYKKPSPVVKPVNIPLKIGQRKVFCKCGQTLKIIKTDQESFVIFCKHCNAEIKVSRFPASFNVIESEFKLTKKMEQKYFAGGQK